MASPDPHWTNLFGYQTPIAEWAAIVALFVSGYAAVTITKVRSQILGRVRLPSLVLGIERNAQAIATLMRDYESNKEQFELELAVCAANLKILDASIKGRTRPTIRSLRRYIRKFNGQTLFSWAPAKSRNEAWRIYTSLNALVEELKHALEDQRVGG